MDTTGTVYLTDAFEGLAKLPDNSIDALITDPPYFLDGMGDTWDESMTEREVSKKQVVSSLRKGMKFDKQQGKDFQEFMEKVAEAALPKLKPGGWLIAFSAPRLYHRLAVGVEDAGYEIRDMWEWLYTQNQVKAMSVARSIVKDSELSPEAAKELAEELALWKTPQVKSCFEPIVLAQKPREGTFYENWRKHRVGLVNVKNGQGTENMLTANVISTEELADILDKTFLVGKPTKKEKGETTHLSVKPLSLMQHLVEVLVPAGGMVLDPFNGSGTTGIAAVLASRNFIGFDNNEKYFKESAKRNGQFFKVHMEESSYRVTSEQKKTLF